MWLDLWLRSRLKPGLEGSHVKKTKARPATFGEFLLAIPKPVQRVLRLIRMVKKGEVPEAMEAMSYGMAATTLMRRWQVYFAAYERHNSHSPMPRGTAAQHRTMRPYQRSRWKLRFLLT